jgi:hypothetical protein
MFMLDDKIGHLAWQFELPKFMKTFPDCPLVRSTTDIFVSVSAVAAQKSLI